MYSRFESILEIFSPRLRLIFLSTFHFGFFCCSVAKSCPTLCNPMNCSTSGSPVLHCLLRVCSHSCPLSRWCHPTISSSAAPFSSCPQFFPASGSFPVSWLFMSGGQSIGALAPVHPTNIQGWLSLGLTGFSWSCLNSVMNQVLIWQNLLPTDIGGERAWSSWVGVESWQSVDTTCWI